MVDPGADDDGDLQEQLERARAEIERLKESIGFLRTSGPDGEAGLKRQLDQLQEQARAERARLRSVYSSKTWRVGRAIVGVGRALQRPRSLARSMRKPNGTLAQRAADAVRELTPAIPTLATVPHYELIEDVACETAYGRATSKRAFGTGGVRLAMAVHTLDFQEGRGDVYTAVGLGRYLERIGYDVVYLPRQEWYRPPDGVEVYLALLDDVDLMEVTARCLRVAWIRNRTTEWTDSPSLPLYDGVLTSSERSLSLIQRVYAGPIGVLRIGVDHELFAKHDGRAREGVASTVNQWGRERQIYEALEVTERDFPLAIFGEQRGLSPILVPHWVGKVSYFALPSLYSQAAIVLDDHNHTTQPFGNVNSRLYESLACGALVITNASLGLHEIGAADVPVYETASELKTLIRHFLVEPDERQMLAERLRSQVLSRHTYEQRAGEFDTFYKELIERSRAARRRIIGFFPDYRHTNPYQEMLYSWGPGTQIAAVPVDQPESLPRSLAEAGDRFVYHLHWTAPILGGAKSEREALKKMAKYLQGVDALHERGARFIWTIHNVLPHESAFPKVEGELRQGLADRADLIHVMCQGTVELVSPYFTVPKDRVRVIPHPSYIGVYPNFVDEARARRELGLHPDDTVIGYFGSIRSYKGIDELLNSFERACAVDERLKLVMAGSATLFPDVARLRERVSANPRIIANFNRIGDGDIQFYLNASDAVVLPHRSVLNSGSLMLAFSFGRPVIAPRSGCLEDLLSDDVALTFSDSDSFYESLLRAEELKAPAYRRAAYSTARMYPVGEVAEQFAKTIEDMP